MKQEKHKSLFMISDNDIKARKSLQFLIGCYISLLFIFIYKLFGDCLLICYEDINFLEFMQMFDNIRDVVKLALSLSTP